MSQMKALVVEDEESLLRAITIKMKDLGIEPYTARSFSEAKEIIGTVEPDVIWLDHYLLGDEDGLDLLKEIKSIEKLKNKPVFVVSNTCSNDKYQEYVSLGIEKFVLKSSARLEDIINDAKKSCS